MKKIIALAAFVLLTVSAFAQEGRTIYNKYSDAERVSAVYISPAMFRMIGKLPDLDIEETSVNLSALVSSLTGLYIIDSENPEINEALKADAVKYIENGKYEMLMEAKDDGETVRIYTMGNEQTVTGLVVFTIEHSECAFICLEGVMPREELEKLLADVVAEQDII